LKQVRVVRDVKEDDGGERANDSSFVRPCYLLELTVER